MGSLLLLVIIIFLAANGDYTLLYLTGGAFAVAVIGSLFPGNRKKTEERPRTKISHPHYIDPDDYECTICGKRFRKNLDACPNCGVRFNRTETDWEEFDDEEELDYMIYGD